MFIVHPSKGADSEGAKKKASADDSIQRAARLARVLASDMLIYNREVVDRARMEGNLAQVLDTEIRRSWQLWKSRFPEESDAQPGLFLEALTDILASGDDSFQDWQPPVD